MKNSNGAGYKPAPTFYNHFFKGFLMTKRTLLWYFYALILTSFFNLECNAQEHARMYRSIDQGNSWTRSDTGFPSKGTVNDFAKFGDILYAGTGADGVFASYDDGQSWTGISLGLPSAIQINAIAAISNTLLIGTFQNGVFISNDGGISWHSSNKGFTNKSVRRLFVYENFIYAATNGGLFVSNDKGKSWNHVTGNGQINGITVFNGNTYLADLQGVMLSKDYGATWKRILDIDTPHNIYHDGNSIFAMTYSHGVKRTDNEGINWINTQSGLPENIKFYTFQILRVHDSHFAGQWPGLFVSRNRGESWKQVNEGLPTDLPITELILSSKGTIIAGAS
jgi:photosystem II stability/assembly factor-like uncharacterized protein